jgi:hypothetical protein
LPDISSDSKVGEAVAEFAKAVDAHATALAGGEPLLGDPLGADSHIVEATKQVFRTLLRAELGLRAAAFDQGEKEDALELQANRDAPDEDEGALDELVELFAELCDRWPEVLDLRYGGTRADFREFRTVFVPALLSALAQWSHEKKSDALTEQLEAVDRRYTAAVRAAERARAEPYEEEHEEGER